MIAIHHREIGFSGKWIEYCEKNDVAYKIVNCFDTNIIEQLKRCEGLMWHWPHHDHRAQLFARQLTYSVEEMGIKVFPNSSTCWHYDDKVGQKYLLEAVDAPLVPSYVFYDKSEAMRWVSEAKFPKVFKKRNGASSHNVRLVDDKNEARKIVKHCFGKGIPSYDKYEMVNESISKFKRDKTLKSIGRIGKYVLKLPLPTRFQPDHTIEKDYAYFQDFIPGNNFDIRVIVIGERAFAIKRYVRENDFRASGSGNLNHEKDEVPELVLKEAFKLSNQLNSQSLAIDFLLDKNNVLILEISYAFPLRGFVENCPGYWDSSLNWHDGQFCPEYFMAEDFFAYSQS